MAHTRSRPVRLLDTTTHSSADALRDFSRLRPAIWVTLGQQHRFRGREKRGMHEVEDGRTSSAFAMVDPTRQHVAFSGKTPRPPPLHHSSALPTRLQCLHMETMKYGANNTASTALLAASPTRHFCEHVQLKPNSTRHLPAFSFEPKTQVRSESNNTSSLDSVHLRPFAQHRNQNAPESCCLRRPGKSSTYPKCH